MKSLRLEFLNEKNINKQNSSFTLLQLKNRIVELESQLEKFNRAKNFGCEICLEQSKNLKMTCHNTENDVSHLSSSTDKNLEEYVDDKIIFIFINFDFQFDLAYFVKLFRDLTFEVNSQPRL